MKSIDLIIESLERKGILTEKTFKNRSSKFQKAVKKFNRKNELRGF
ncbi:hypothetical protein [Bacillus tequilensis]|uniref:Uncharacterized protein n=1 Tax=Bacillus tequilensis TaxID=227866 RepID=A0A6H0WCX7_9BACI|nr:hypothetical protein [Bacillus tequilensis]QIW78370.1 hypothetical protein G4P54_02730 [Bacillus tequilensis]